MDYFGYQTRKPYQGELKYFKDNPTVSGMAAEDNRIILNPYSTLSESERQAVARNEAARLYMRNNNAVPDFAVTPKQASSFKDTAYASDPLALKRTIAARILSGDPSAGDATPQQKAWAENLRKSMETPRSKASNMDLAPTALDLGKRLKAKGHPSAFVDAIVNASYNQPSKRDISDAKWRLRRIQEEKSVWERPGEEEVPAGAMGYMDSRGFQENGILRDDELAPRPDAEGWSPDKISPKFTRETGIYATPGGEVKNIGSKVKKRGYEANEENRKRYSDLLKEEKELQEKIAKAESDMTEIPGYGIWSKKDGKQLAEAPKETPWGQTEQGEKFKATMAALKDSGNLSKAQELQLNASYDELGKINEALLSGMADMRPMDEETKQRYTARRDELMGQIQSVTGGAPATGETPPGTIQIKGQNFTIQDGLDAMREDPKRWESIKGNLPPEYVQAVEGQGAPQQPAQQSVDQSLAPPQAAPKPAPQRPAMETGLTPVSVNRGATTPPPEIRQPRMGAEPRPIIQTRSGIGVPETTPEERQAAREIITKPLAAAWDPKRAARVSSSNDLGDIYGSVKRSAQNVGGYLGKLKEFAEKSVPNRRLILQKVQDSKGTEAMRQLDQEMLNRTGETYFDQQTGLIRPEALPVLEQVAMEMGFTEQEIAALLSGEEVAESPLQYPQSVRMPVTNQVRMPISRG